MKLIIRGTSASMLTIGKTFEENLNCTIILKINAATGVQKIILATTKTVAQISTDVKTVMAGRSRNIIQKVIS